jgi:hypothetical protein
MNTIIESLDYRSQSVLKQIANDIELLGSPIFLNNYINIKYRFRDEDLERELRIDSPLEFAAFAHHQQLIACYDVDEEGVHMYQRIIQSGSNRFNYPFSRPGYIQVDRINTGFTEQEIIRMIAVREYDFGSRSYSYKAKKGVIIPMPPPIYSNTKTAA